MKLADAWYWGVNKKPRSKNEIYFNRAGYYVLGGSFIMLSTLGALMLLSGGIASDLWTVVAVVAMLLFTVFWFVMGYRNDKNKGYVDALYEHYTKRRNKFMEEHGLKD